MDPFAGKGTTVLQACAEGRTGIGIDPSPESYAFTAAKVKQPDLVELRNRIDDLSNDMFFDSADNEPEAIKIRFAPRLLDQLVFLKKNLQQENPTDAFLIGVILGMLQSKGEIRDLFAELRKRVDRILRLGVPPLEGRVWRSRVQDIHEIPDPALKRKKIGLIFGMPPQPGVHRMGFSEQICYWFLGENPDIAKMQLDRHCSLVPWLAFLHDACRMLYQVADEKCVCAFVLPDCRLRGYAEPVILAQEAWEFLKHKRTKWQFGQIIKDKRKASAKPIVPQGMPSAENANLEFAEVSRIATATVAEPVALVNRVLVLCKGDWEEMSSEG